MIVTRPCAWMEGG